MTAITTPPEAATGAELIRWAFDVLNTRDITPLRRFWSDATVERFPTETCVGEEAIGGYFEAAFAAMPDMHIEIVGMAEQGEDVFAHWHMRGTHSGASWHGVAPTGKVVELDGIDHFVVRDGHIVSNFVVFDQLQFARQVGMMPSDGSPVDRAMKAAFGAKTRLLRRAQR